jgi:DNA helicase HerA-like ATPase
MPEMLEAYDDATIDYIIVRPPVEMLGSPQELDDYLFYHYAHLRDSVCYIDEAYTFHNNGRAYRGLIALLSRGRSRGITTIISTQRPRGISLLCITEAQKVYVFRLADRNDRKRIGDIIPNFDEYRLPPKHGFYYFESGEDNAHLFRPVTLDRSLDTGYTDEPATEDDDAVRYNQSPATKHIWV